MARQARSGVIYPIPYTQTKKLKDGRERNYSGFRAKVDGKWVFGKTYKICDKKIKKALAEQSEWGMSIDRAAKLGKYAEAWLASKKLSTDPSTYRGYMSAVHLHLKPYLDKPIADFNPTICRRIIEQMKAYDHKGQPSSKASISSRRILHTTLNQIFKSAVADRIIPTNPMIAVKPPQRKDVEQGDEAESKSFTVKQMQDMLSIAAERGPRNGAIWWWRLLTGMRQGEILGASVDDLEFSKSAEGIPYARYTVNYKLEQVAKQHGCGEPNGSGIYPCDHRRAAYCPQSIWRVPEGFDIVPMTGRWCLTRPKSKTGRIVPIIPILAQVMSSYLEATELDDNPYGLLFHDKHGNPINPADDEKEFRDLMREAGIPNPEKRRGHETRHSTVTLLSSMGVDVGLIMQIVGHSSIAMVEHYRHADITERLNAMQTLDSSLNLSQIEWTK